MQPRFARRSASDAAAKAAQDPELAAAAGKIKDRRDALAAECAALRKSLDAKEETGRKAAEAFTAAERARADLAGAKERIAVLGVADPKQVGRLVGDIMKTHKGQVEAGDVKRVAEELLKG